MGKPKNRRWVCDLCGSTALAPGRARLHDVRRWCLPCSEKHGVLVPRVCPVLEREREQKAHAARTRRKDKAARDRAAVQRYGTVGRIHIPAEFARLLGVPSAAPALAHGAVDLVIQRKSQEPRHVGLASWSRRQVTVYTWPGCKDYSVAATLAHEIAHLASPPTCAHGPSWRTNFLEIVRDGYPGIEIPSPESRRYSALDYAVERGIDRWLTGNLDAGLAPSGGES